MKQTKKGGEFIINTPSQSIRVHDRSRLVTGPYANLSGHDLN